MKVRGHTLVGALYDPKWLEDSHFTRTNCHTSPRPHQHRRGPLPRQVFAWDVVNEAFDERRQLQDSVWYNQPGIGLAGQGNRLH